MKKHEKMGMNRYHLLCTSMYLVGFDQFPALHRVDAGHLGSQWLGAVGDAQGF